MTNDQVGETKISGGWKSKSGSGIILNLDEHEGINSPDHKRLMISSKAAGDRLVAWLRANGFGDA
jgi:hypothetical protein